MFDSDFLMWKNPALTGAALAAFNVLYLMVVFFDVCMAPFFCRLGIFFIFMGLAVKFALPNLMDGKEDPQPFSQELVQKAAVAVTTALNKFCARAVDTVMWKSSSKTAKALVVLEVVRRLAPWFSLNFLVFLFGNGVFALSYVTENKWNLIEEHVMPQVHKVLAIKDQVLSKIPKYTDLKDQKWD